MEEFKDHFAILVPNIEISYEVNVHCLCDEDLYMFMNLHPIR